MLDKKGSKEKIIAQGKRVLTIESRAIDSLIQNIDENFVMVVTLLEECKGRVVVTGMGKSGIIGKKIASTLASIGTPTLFLHPAEGIHGDLGMVAKGDIIIAISNSGETEEIIKIIPQIKRCNSMLIGFVGNKNSTVARLSDIVIDVSVEEEACPLNLVPTASTTAALAMGDAIAIALLSKKGIQPEDFAVFHPGGTLGKRLVTKVEDIMHKGADIPIVFENTPFKDIIFEISSKKLGMTSVIDENGVLSGIITDGDLRRVMESGRNIFDKRALDMMTKNPKTIASSSLAAKAVGIMEEYSITHLLILSIDKKPVGVVHLHDILKAGIV